MATPPPLRWVLWRSISVVASERRISFLLSKDFVLSDKILPWNFTIPARFCSSDTKWSDLLFVLGEVYSFGTFWHLVACRKVILRESTAEIPHLEFTIPGFFDPSIAILTSISSGSLSPLAPFLQRFIVVFCDEFEWPKPRKWSKRSEKWTLVHA